jgi:hypothetical protein
MKFQLDDRLVPPFRLAGSRRIAAGRIDAAFIIAAEKRPGRPGADAFARHQSDELCAGRAYQRRFPFLTKLTFPHGRG